jgi:hypothetical protein
MDSWRLFYATSSKGPEVIVAAPVNAGALNVARDVATNIRTRWGCQARLRGPVSSAADWG